jgi:urocanate hydratase
MAHPNIMTERMKDGSDAIADWPLLDAMMLCASIADLVAVQSDGGGYSGYMTSTGATLVADGTRQAAGGRTFHSRSQQRHCPLERGDRAAERRGSWM